MASQHYGRSPSAGSTLSHGRSPFLLKESGELQTWRAWFAVWPIGYFGELCAITCTAGSALFLSLRLGPPRAGLVAEGCWRPGACARIGREDAG